ncbi:PREDICTED: uncharacterized protein LOC105136916 isoform X2 [Populus euphratica]|uniref:Golgi apparatus membrane protein TVP23 n=1 Tax=Populus euphratica TaxID=75702 RepID=A0AAJ6V366_POPEU|nr:PREDICTED: uncharacterized protein LOC105136916 isoform X2 [Populus euphratica]
MRIQRHVSFQLRLDGGMSRVRVSDFNFKHDNNFLSQSLARLNMKDSWLVWWTLFLNVHAAAWVILGIFSIKRFEADYVLVVAVCGSLSIANIAGFTKCRKASAGDKISTESKYHAVLTSLDVLKFLLIWKMVTCYCDHQNHETFFISMSRIQFLLAFDQD